jgi:hypothetical protein
MYTGHLTGFTLDCKKTKCKAKRWRISWHPHHFTFVPRAGEGVVVGGKVYQAETTWTSEEPSTYVYFGTIEPLVAPELTAIVDPGLPGWAHTHLLEWMPKLFRLYADAFDQDLPQPATVFFNYSDKGSGWSLSGGVVPEYIVQLQMAGEGWSKDSAVSTERLSAMIAHESAHLWNAHLAENGDTPAWVHEGGADAIAEWALGELGIIDNQRAAEIATKSILNCMYALDAGSVHSAAERRAYRQLYACGRTVFLFTEALMRKTDPDASILDFWRVFLASALENGGEYTEAMYFDQLETYEGGAKLAVVLRDFLDEPVKPQFFIDQLDALAIPYELSDEGSDSESFVRKALAHVMREDCGGAASLSSEPDFIYLEGMDHCAVLKDNLHVSTVGGYRIDTEGLRAYRAAENACLNERTVVLGTTEGNTVAVPCHAPLPPMKWLRLLP